MATKLCSKGETKAADRKLIGTGSKLLIIKKSSAWTNKELIVTPVEQRFTAAASYGDCDGYNSDVYDTSDTPYIEVENLRNRLLSVRNAKTAADWQAGYKPLYYYTARSYPPYRIRTDGSLSSTKVTRSLELGADWCALRFDFKALPVGMCHASRVYLRLYDPSFVQCTRDSGQNDGYAWNFAYNNAANIHYHFDNELLPACQHVASGYGTVNLPSIANCQAGNASDCNCIFYDIYGSHNQTTTNAAYYTWQRTSVYRKTNSTSAYYKDVEITDANVLQGLFNAMRSGPVWMHLGFALGNMIWDSRTSRGMRPYTTLMAFVSRIEMVLSLTMPSFND